MIFAGVLLLLILLYLFLLRCRRGNSGLKALQGWYYAHRGLHSEGCPENSMAAFRKAVEAGYGMEFDLHLLADGNIAVIHDSLLKRTTGLEGNVEDLTVEDLKHCYLEGTEETIPLFTELLEMVDGRVPLIVELKPHNNNHKVLAQKVCDILDGYQGVTCLESFDPRCMREVKKYRPKAVRGQLAHNSLKEGGPAPYVIRLLLTNNLMNFMSVPDFIAYRYRDRKTLSNFLCRKLWGAQGVTWTVRSLQDLEIAAKEGWLVIFENFTP